jgi:hypothetical protein
MSQDPHRDILAGQNPTESLLPGQQALEYTSVLLQKMKTRAADAGLNCDLLGASQNSDVIFDSKSVHSLAAVGFLSECLKATDPNSKISKEAVGALVGLEMLSVDIVDSLGELDPLRNQQTQLNLFEGIREALFQGKLPDNVLPILELEDHNVMLGKWKGFLLTECQKFNADYIQTGVIPQEIVTILEEMNTAYFNFIAIAHAKPGDTPISRQYFLDYQTTGDLQSKKQRPEWLDSSSELWPLFFGESISWLAVTLLSANKNIISVEQVYKLIGGYRTTGILNVILDDLVDVEEDRLKGDPNLWQEISDGKYGIGNEELISNDNDNRLLIAKLKKIYECPYTEPHKIFLFALIREAQKNFLDVADIPIVMAQSGIIQGMLQLYRQKCIDPAISVMLDELIEVM